MNRANSVVLPQLVWHGVNKREFLLPDKWEVEICNMAGYDRSALTPSEISAAITNPIGTSRIKDLARGENITCP